VAALLSRVQAATLLIAGDDDAEILAAHHRALRTLVCAKRLEILPGSGARFDDADATATAAHLAGQWFVDHLAPQRPLA
jgi:putative phosphoribosyl transferase